MKHKKFLIVEDDSEQLKRYCDLVRELDFEVHFAKGFVDALDVLSREDIDILLTDIHLSNSPHQKTFEGYKIIEYVRENCPEILPIIMSFDPRIETFNKAMEIGAASFIKKPLINSQEIEIAIITGKEKRSYQNLKRVVEKEYENKRLIGNFDGIVLSESMRKDAVNIARSKEFTCVILGETGSGKEELAKFIHRKRVAIEGMIPFVAVNCANIETSLAVSQLFGHRKGAFTGADQACIGYVGEADGGILFLDEIHHLSPECQRKLLRVLHDGSYQRLGDTKTLYSKFQLIVATTQDLDEMVDKGQFLLDLRARMIGIDIVIPPLRDRLHDIEDLLTMFFSKENIHVEENHFHEITKLCKSFDWPGNIRQLYRVIKTMIMRSQLEDLPLSPSLFPISKNLNRTQEIKVNKELLKQNDLIKNAVEILMKSCYEDVTLKKAVEATEIAIIKTTFARYKKIGDALAALDMPRSTYDGKRRQYNLV